MIEITRTRTIAAKPQAVWDLLADFGAISTWADNVDHSCLLERQGDDGPVGTTRRIQTRRRTVVERIVEYDAPTTLAYDIEGLPSRLRTVRNRWHIQAVDDGSTAVALTTTVDVGPRPPQQLVARVVGRVLAKQSDVMLTGLADHLERRDG